MLLPHSITQLLIPKAICVLCQQSHTTKYPICMDCHTLLPRLEHGCSYCAHPLPRSSTASLCAQCCQKKPSFDRVFTAYQFEEPLRSLLHEFKYNAGLYLARYLSSLMLEVTISSESECLLPIPLHRKRLRLRTFNQASVLARLLGKQTNQPVNLNWCKKTIQSMPQAQLSAKERRHSVSKAYQVQSLPYQHVTLVDDIITTGSTAASLARQLKASGVKRVDVWCCARTIHVPRQIT